MCRGHVISQCVSKCINRQFYSPVFVGVREHFGRGRQCKAIVGIENGQTDRDRHESPSGIAQYPLVDPQSHFLQDDAKLVAILYRTHKSLPNSAKVSSLYAFDALARAARSAVTKNAITGDLNSEKGNAATFLLKIEGVLDGLFQDMIAIGNPEAKVSHKNTFPCNTRSTTTGWWLQSFDIVPL